MLEVHVNTGGHLTDWQRVPLAEDMLLRFSDDGPAGVTRLVLEGEREGFRRGTHRRVPRAPGSAATKLNSGGREQQGKRALAGAIAPTGLLAMAGPAVAKDR